MPLYTTVRQDRLEKEKRFFCRTSGEAWTEFSTRFLNRYNRRSNSSGSWSSESLPMKTCFMTGSEERAVGPTALLSVGTFLQPRTWRPSSRAKRSKILSQTPAWNDSQGRKTNPRP